MRAMPDRWKPNVTVAAIIERDGRFLLVEEKTPNGFPTKTPQAKNNPPSSPKTPFFAG
jgi:hypothetical protein